MASIEQHGNGITRYSGLQRGLHWLTAITVVGLFGMGLWMRELGYYDAWYHKAPFWHKSIGLTLCVVVIVRLVARVVKGHPPALATHAQWERLLARATHLALYVLLFTAFASGYLISTADNRPTPFFGWFEIPAAFTAFEHQEDVAGIVHQIAVWSLIVLASLHAIAALKHHFIDRDATLRRML